MPETTFDAPSRLKSSIELLNSSVGSVSGELEGHKQQDENEINNESERRHHSKDTRSSTNPKVFLSRRYAENSIKTSKSSSRISSVVADVRSVLRSHRANFRCRTLLRSHMAPKRTLCYKCSSCNFTAQSSNTVQNHIRQVSKIALFHKKSASRAILVKLPNDGNFKVAKIQGKSKYHEQLSSKKKLKINQLMTEPVESLAENSRSARTNIVMTEIPANFTDVPAIDQSTAVSSSVMEFSAKMGDIGLDCVPSAKDLNISIESSYDSVCFKFKLSNLTDANVDKLVKELAQCLKEKELLNAELEVNYRNLETTETQARDTQQAILEQQKKIDDFKDKFAQQHNLFERSTNPILSVLTSLTELRQKAHAKWSMCNKQRLFKEIEYRTGQTEALEIQLRMTEVDEDSEELKRLEKELADSKEKTAKLEDQSISLSKDLLELKEEEQALDLQITKVADTKGEMEIMEATVSSLQDHLLILRSKKKDLITDQIKRLDAQVMLDVKIVELNCRKKLKAINKSRLESFKKLSQFSKTFDP